MAYRLNLADGVADSVRACAREQLEDAVGQLTGTAKDPASGVHEARKSLKKTRALLRIARPALGKSAYRRENEALRDAAAELSATRDADVLVATLEALERRAVGRLPAAGLASLRAALVAEAEAEHKGGGDRTSPAASDGASATSQAASADPAASTEAETTSVAVAGRLREALDRIAAWPLDHADWDVVLEGTLRAYTRGSGARELAEADPTVEHLHAWRKRVKDLWYHHRLLKPVWPRIVSAYADEAHELSELLGDDHDLAVLRDRLTAGVTLPPGTALDVDALLEILDERRAELQEGSRRLGARLYAESPKAFSRRLRRWVEAAVAEEQATPGTVGSAIADV
ncbi:MAG TPA: CHAD domain-containing protein [Conexibacter sp.]|jgi:CHAD domain-containing protein